MHKYPARFDPADEGGYTVTFRDIPEAITQGDTLAEALEMARDALTTAMEFYFESGRIVPRPSALGQNERLVELPPSVAAKVELLNARLQTGARPADVARAMGCKAQEMTRVFDFAHSTKIDTVAEALQVMGYELELTVRRIVNAVFIGGPLSGSSLLIADQSEYTASDQETGRDFVYERHTAMHPVGPEVRHALYVPKGLSREEANQQIKQAFPSRNQQ